MSGRIATVACALLGIATASWIWTTTTQRYSTLYAANRHVVESARAFEAVTGDPLCVTLARRVVGWHGVDLRWRLLPEMADHVDRRSASCVAATVDYLDGRDVDDIAANVIATERPPPAMDQAIGLFVDAGAARDRWRAARPPVPLQSFNPLDESERNASVTLRGTPPATVKTGQSITVEVDIRNDAKHTTWPADQDGPKPIWLGGRTFEKDSTTTVGEFRSRIEAGLGPGETTRQSITIGPFGEPGTYRVEIGMLQEAVAWFGEDASFDIRVVPR
jgi:hypothetical protein